MSRDRFPGSPTVAHLAVEARRRCPRCRHEGPFAEYASRWLHDLATCPGCELVFSNVAVPAVPPSGIEYLDRFHEICGPRVDSWLWHEGFEVHTMRRELVKHYAWAIPTPRALETIAALGPVVEIGAGGGYWAMLLRERGVDVRAFDVEPHKNHWVEHGWSDVETGGPEVLREIERRTLLLCWPPMSEMALESLARSRGDTVVYIGEDEGGCTADRVFFRALERVYRHVDTLAIPSWPGIHDHLQVWSKKRSSA